MDSYFSTRSSCRTFTKQDVSDSTIKAILEAAVHAPTTGNMQLYSVIVTRDAAKKAEMAPAHFSQPAYTNAPVILTFCADINRFVRWCRESGAEPGFDNLQSLVAAALDAVILAQQFVTIAEREGLGTCYLGTTTYNPDIIARVLELPPRVVPVTTVALGYPSAVSGPTERLPVEAVMHDEVYRDYTADDIKRLYSDKENLAENQAFVRENNKSSLAQVFTDIRYPRVNNEAFSAKLANFIKSRL